MLPVQAAHKIAIIPACQEEGKAQLQGTVMHGASYPSTAHHEPQTHGPP